MAALILVLLASALVPLQGATDLRQTYKDRYARRLEPLLCEVVEFRTAAGNTSATAEQAKWLQKQAKALGLVHRDAGPVTEIELTGPAGAPVLGLVVHGDVQPPGDSGWTVPPFTCTKKGAYLYGRGVADDKGPLVQALLALATLQTDTRPRTHTIRLLVGSDEESENQDFATYLKTHQPPDVTLVLDSEFPVVVGEKAWDLLTLTVADPYRSRSNKTEMGSDPISDRAYWVLLEAEAGVTPSIVPQRAIAKLRWASDNPAAFEQARASLCPATIPEGYSCETRGTPSETILTVTGRAAHSGMNLAGGRNALVLLANVLNGRLESSPAASLLEFAAIAGEDLHGAGLGIDQRDPLWGQYGVNVAMLKPAEGGKLALSINLRRIPPMNQAQIKEHLTRHVAKFTEPRGLKVDIGGFFGDEPFIVPPDAKLVRRLLAAFERATGTKPPPAIAGGGTYAKRLPNAIAFGMWFPGTPYPGHDVDERIMPADLHRGMDVLLEALNDLAYSAPIDRPLVP